MNLYRATMILLLSFSLTGCDSGPPKPGDDCDDLDELFGGVLLCENASSALTCENNRIVRYDCAGTRGCGGEHPTAYCDTFKEGTVCRDHEEFTARCLPGEPNAELRCTFGEGFDLRWVKLTCPSCQPRLADNDVDCKF